MNVFAYGTLAIPAVMTAVTGQEFPHQKATAYNYHRALLQGKIYPGIIEQEGAVTTGRVYFAVDDEAIGRLDWYEDNYYERRCLEIETEAGKIVPAYAYVIPAALASLLDQVTWNENWFIENHLESFLRRLRP
jgi:gamma-glutamylcyclotransferase (GGCT)/AIG2-like uncharacterized protein YtfP